MNRSGISLGLLSAMFLGSLIVWAQTTAPIHVRHEPTDEPTMKIDDHGDADVKFMRLHAQFLQQAKDGGVDLLFLGDSITEGWFWGNNRDIWNAHFGKYNPANFGIGGDRTEHVLWRIENGELDGKMHPKVIVLMIGTNNIGWPAADIEKGVRKIIDVIHQKQPDAKLLLLAIFPRGADPKDPQVVEMREKIKTVNAGLATLDDGSKTRFLDIGDKFLSPDGTISKDIMPDALHPNHNGYQIWANAMQPLLDEMMK
jgi:lysophospholipase L1-like esterase